MMLSMLLQDIECQLDGSDVEVTSITSDSRQVRAGALFVAVPGTAVDGHRFIPAAVEQGAAAVVSERHIDVAISSARVPDSRVAIALAARRFYSMPDEALTMVGVTGTNGKTTTATLIAGMLRSRRSASLGTLGLLRDGRRFDTGLTTPGPVALARILRELVDEGVGALAMEVSSHALHQHRVAGVSFDVGVFTNLSRDHLDYHETMDAYFNAKAMLFRERLRGAAVLNVDDEFGQKLAREFPDALTFGHGDAARVQVVRAQSDLSGIRVVVRIDGRTLEIASPMVGDFNVSNVLAAVATGVALGLEDAEIIVGIEAVEAVPGRLERVSAEGQPLVFVDYAHTPDALEKVLSVLRPLTRGRLVAVMGCGGDRDVGKRSAMGAASAQGASFTYVTNDNPRTEDPVLIAQAIERGMANVGAQRGEQYDVVLDRAEAIERAIRDSSADDVVLIAGKGHEDYQIIGDVRRHFDDREVARGVLAAVGG
ncbi:MAG: UDP-N-acetylmuramoyl-L-alanyl-D-glutamate--2,6-diaminopimelate ligase [Myxococcota bacterium]